MTDTPRTRLTNRVDISVSVRATMNEIQALGADRAKAFLRGIAEVIAAGRNEIQQEAKRD